MERSCKKTIVFCLSAAKCIRAMTSRIRKSTRKIKMRQFRITVGVLGAGSCFITMLLYYWHRNMSVGRHISLTEETQRIVTEESIVLGTPMVHVPLNEIYKETASNDSDQSFLMGDMRRAPFIDTNGCQIPVSVVDYEKFLRKQNKGGTCGKRAVFLKKDNNDRVRVIIKNNVMKKYLRKSARFDCCYRFIHRSPQLSMGNKRIKFTTCKKLLDGSTITLETDFVNVKCSEYDKRNQTHEVYDDVYAFVKKLNTSQKHKEYEATCPKSRFNVLLIGMDSMSLSRFSKSMIRSVNFFRDNFWLGYRAYHKVGDNTFPNLMAVFSGQNLSTLLKTCLRKMDDCNDNLIWSKFKQEGYVTAYGEDYLRLPDTFNGNYAFKNAPTDHYMRPLYIKGEKELYNKSLVCSGKVPSAHHILEYALDFALTYRNESFFGLFWINSYSHNENSHPEDADKMLENFLNRLTYTRNLDNTFVIFFSDHGIRFGAHRLKVESYYDERMPSMFIWTPVLFKERFSKMYNGLIINQFRLVTPYDLYNTLMEVNHMSSCRGNITESFSDACPKCQSLFRVVSGNRTCEDVAIEPKWCSCHKLFPLDPTDMDGAESVSAVISHIRSRTKSVKVKHCWACMNLSLKNILRVHFYYDKEKTKLYHVVAFTLTPGNVSYEATVFRNGSRAELVGTVSVISSYRGLGKCTIQSKDRLFCVCQKLDNCH